jgi:HCOMODA/2-hydroxy-3-carboxy-muconic semialdehyde decarboxylase
MIEPTAAVRLIVAANRILAHEGVIDAYGHVSMRHPERGDRFLLARSVSPQFVTEADILEFDLNGRPVEPNGPPPYLERFIHAGLYAARLDVGAAVHAHTTSVLPFTISRTPLRAVVQDASDLGTGAPVWDIRDGFGDETNLLVTGADKGRSLAETLGDHRVVLLRGHGFAAVAASVPEVVRSVIALARNAEVQTAAMALGEIVGLSEGEIRAQRALSSDPDSPALRRSWQYFANRAGCADLIADHPHPDHARS